MSDMSDWSTIPRRWYDRVMDGLVSIYEKVNVKTAVFVSITAPVLLFLKDFALATLSLVQQTFGNVTSLGASDILLTSFSRVLNFSFVSVNVYLSQLVQLSPVNVGFLFRLCAFDRYVDIGTWYICSLLVVFFLRFVWSCFKFIVEHTLSALT